MTAAVLCAEMTVVGAVVYHVYGVRLFTVPRPPLISEYAEDERRIYLYAAVNLKRRLTNNRRLRSTYCTVEANYSC